MWRPAFALAALLSAFAVRADRVRVVVAVDVPQVSAASVQSLRASVIESLESASGIEVWGAGRAFSAEIDRSDIEILTRDPRVRAVEIDAGGEGALMESLPLIGMQSVRTQGYDGADTTVAVLDTGIDVANPDFAGRIVAQQCFCDNLDGTGCCPNGRAEQSGPGAADDDHGHGTHVSGIIAGNGVSSPMGVAPAARIVAVKVMDGTNSFRSFTQIYRALEWILLHQPEVRVINMSLGSYVLYSGTCDSTAIALGLSDVIDNLRKRGVLITASTGNQGSKNSLALPACVDEVLGVGATYDSAGSFSFFGCSDTTTDPLDVTCFTNSSDAVDLVAPGAPIVASRRGGGFTTFAGTSMAAPHVAGVIALMQQVSGGAIDADTVESILESTGRAAIDKRNGKSFPSLDAAQAIDATPRPPKGPRKRSVRK
jgi:subtilisin family serine protease